MPSEPKDPKGQKPDMKADKQPMPMRPNMLTVPEADFTVKETNPDLGKAVDYNHHYDLVEHMTYLFIRIVKARGLAAKDADGSSDPVSPARPCYRVIALLIRMAVFNHNCEILISFIRARYKTTVRQTHSWTREGGDEDCQA